MASFDIIDASGYGYRAAWNERRYLMRLAAGPLLIKFVCMITVESLGWGTDFILRALIMLPSYFADGWMLAHFVRLIFLGQRWPFIPSGDRDRDALTLRDRAQGVMGGALVFVVTRFLLAGLTHFIVLVTPAPDAAAQGQVPPAAGAAALGLFMFFIWAFRFLWLYIPAAVSYSLGQCLREIRGFTTSFYLIGTFLVCYMPLNLLLGVMVSSILVSYPTAVPAGVIFMKNFLEAMTDTAVILVATAGLAWGLRAMISTRLNGRGAA